MLAKNLAVGVVALAGLTWAAPARGDDIVRLSLSADTHAPTLNLKANNADLDADVFAVHRGYRGGYRGGYYGGYRGFYAGYRGFYGYRGFHGYRGYYGYRPFYGYGYGYRAFYPRYYGGYAYPSYYSYYSYPIYSYPVYSYPVYSYYYPCAGTSPALTVTLGVNPSSASPTTPPPSLAPVPGGSGGSGTYPYDGGPSSPVPMPKADEAPTIRVPSRPALVEERFVSFEEPTAKTGKWVYPAYGETPTRKAR